MTNLIISSELDIPFNSTITYITFKSIDEANAHINLNPTYVDNIVFYKSNITSEEYKQFKQFLDTPFLIVKDSIYVFTTNKYKNIIQEPILFKDIEKKDSKHSALHLVFDNSVIVTKKTVKRIKIKDYEQEKKLDKVEVKPLEVKEEDLIISNSNKDTVIKRVFFNSYYDLIYLFNNLDNKRRVIIDSEDVNSISVAKEIVERYSFNNLEVMTTKNLNINTINTNTLIVDTEGYERNYMSEIIKDLYDIDEIYILDTYDNFLWATEDVILLLPANLPDIINLIKDKDKKDKHMFNNVEVILLNYSLTYADYESEELIDAIKILIDDDIDIRVEDIKK